MQKRYCDGCGKELTNSSYSILEMWSGVNLTNKRWDLCDDKKKGKGCAKRVAQEIKA